MPSYYRFLALTLLGMIAGCATAPPASVAASQTLLLISVDGLRPSDVTAEQMPTLNTIAERGVRAEGMQPSFPSLTFPNHYTLVTGLRPDHHGIVNNTMQDPQLGTFRLSATEAVRDGRWWDEATPVWVSVQRAGLRSATMFWPGSEAEIHGVRPWQWRPYDGKVTADQRVDQVLEWIALPAQQRPRFITLYFDEVDHASHNNGPDSAQARASRQAVDAALKRLYDGLQTHGVQNTTNIIIASDHGFATVPPAQLMDMGAIASRDMAEAVTAGQVLSLQPQLGNTVQAMQHLLGRHDHYQCWRKQDLPTGWHYGSNPRIPAIVCQTDDGWDALFTNRYTQLAKHPETHGSHGFDPTLPSMRATFIATGPAFAQGTRLPLFDNVDVYPLLMRLLQLTPEANDGDITPLLPALKHPQ